MGGWTGYGIRQAATTKKKKKIKKKKKARKEQKNSRSTPVGIADFLRAVDPRPDLAGDHVNHVAS